MRNILTKPTKTPIYSPNFARGVQSISLPSIGRQRA